MGRSTQPTGPVILVEIDAAALAEAVDAQGFYEAQHPGLGAGFAAELDKALARIATWPMIWPPFSARTRRYLMDRFPYSVVYASAVRRRG